jgi:hypothetical protein
MTMKLRIFQYIDPKETDPDKDTRWIAARDEVTAETEAKRRGWEPCGGEIFAGRPLPCKTAADYKRAGCDVVLP